MKKPAPQGGTGLNRCPDLAVRIDDWQRSYGRLTEMLKKRRAVFTPIATFRPVLPIDMLVVWLPPLL